MDVENTTGMLRGILTHAYSYTYLNYQKCMQSFPNSIPHPLKFHENYCRNPQNSSTPTPGPKGLFALPINGLPALLKALPIFSASYPCFFMSPVFGKKKKIMQFHMEFISPFEALTAVIFSHGILKQGDIHIVIHTVILTIRNVCNLLYMMQPFILKFHSLIISSTPKFQFKNSSQLATSTNY